MLAAAVIIMLPVVLVFVLLQRRFIAGMTAAQLIHKASRCRGTP